MIAQLLTRERQAGKSWYAGVSNAHPRGIMALIIVLRKPYWAWGGTFSRRAITWRDEEALY